MKYLSKAAAVAKWLWLLPPVRSAILTNVARVVGGGTVFAIVAAIADAAAR